MFALLKPHNRNDIMASEILMPRQGQSVESCIIIEWKKQEGDPISEGDILCEVETDKATFEVESTVPVNY